MEDDMSIEIDPPNTDISTGLISDHEFSLLGDFRLDLDPNHFGDLFELPEFNEKSSYQQNLEGTSTSKLERSWIYVQDDPCPDNSTHGNYGVCSSSECRSVGSESQSQASTYGFDIRKANHDSASKSVESSIKHLSLSDFPSFASENDEDDVMPSESDRDDMQSESTINLKDGAHEINIQVPERGLVFSSEDEAYNFYRSYAIQTGFSVRKGKIRRLADGTVRERYFFCSKQGFRLKKQSDKTTKYKRKETRTGCGAFVQFTIDNGKWEITRVVLYHNHDMGGSSQMDIVSPCAIFSKEDARVHSIKQAGMEKEAGDANSARFHHVDGTNYLSIEKINILPAEDGQSLINFLKHLQLEDPLFFHTVQVDVKSCLINFFWRDGRSKIDYEYFGDVVILDTTFRIDRYDIICAPFWGLNHHQQNVLFGCAFLLDASVESFVWLFRTFVEAMGMHPPKTIFTEGCQAISDAIERALPETQHRIGKWFILQNAREYLSEFYRQQGFADLFNKCIYCNSKEQFQTMWDSLLAKYNLHANSWLKNLHMMREKWSDVFSKNTFSAGIESLPRCEDIYNVFHPLTRGAITLSTFVEQYMRAAEKWRREEIEQDFHCSESEPTMILRGNELEKQAANLYTRTIFKLFQEELLGCLSLAVEEISRDEGFSKFKLTEEGQKESIVEFSCLESKVTCSCRKYESVGILCVHSLKVLNAKNIFYIPPQYILKRWKKSVKDGMVPDDGKKEITHQSQGSSYKSRLMLKALHIVNKSLGVERSLQIVDDHLDSALREIEYVLKTEKTRYLKAKDAELHYVVGDINGPESMEPQTTVSSPLSFTQKELHKHSVKVPVRRKRESEMRGTDRNSGDYAINYHQPHNKARQDNDDQGSRTIFGSPEWIGENSSMLTGIMQAMHSSIAELNSKISFFMAENAGLRQQLSGCNEMLPPHPQMGVYPPPDMEPMPYVWMKPQGSQTPLVPIPRFKLQRNASPAKAKKRNGSKTKRVASVSFVGLLWLVVFFGWLVPFVAVKYGGIRDSVSSGYFSSRFYDQQRGRVLTVNGHSNGSHDDVGIGCANGKFDIRNRIHYERGVQSKDRGSQPSPGPNEFVGNSSEPLDKLSNMTFEEHLSQQSKISKLHQRKISKLTEEIGDSASSQSSDSMPFLPISSGTNRLQL